MRISSISFVSHIMMEIVDCRCCKSLANMLPHCWNEDHFNLICASYRIRRLPLLEISSKHSASLLKWGSVQSHFSLIWDLRLPLLSTSSKQFSALLKWRSQSSSLKYTYTYINKICTVYIWRCEHHFCVDILYAPYLYINFAAGLKAVSPAALWIDLISPPPPLSLSLSLSLFPPLPPTLSLSPASPSLSLSAMHDALIGSSNPILITATMAETSARRFTLSPGGVPSCDRVAVCTI